ncbi:hypothetical protein Hanom_Chr04g00341421 [Helianthus anomalus]
MICSSRSVNFSSSRRQYSDTKPLPRSSLLIVGITNIHSHEPAHKLLQPLLSRMDIWVWIVVKYLIVQVCVSSRYSYSSIR